jgi:hypothetical protein
MLPRPQGRPGKGEEGRERGRYMAEEGERKGEGVGVIKINVK